MLPALALTLSLLLGRQPASPSVMSSVNPSEKDPNIEAVGIGGQIYGKRADMIIVDDAVTLKNANEFEKQIRWLTQDVRSRLEPNR
jgi:hypothetical protein